MVASFSGLIIAVLLTVGRLRLLIVLNRYLLDGGLVLTSMLKQAQMEYRLCSYCNDIRFVLAGVGLGMQARGRFEVVQLDDAKISPGLQALTGYVSVLVFTCVSIGAVCFVPRKEMDCTSTALSFLLVGSKKMVGSRF